MHHRIKFGYVVFILLAFGGSLTAMIIHSSKQMYAIAENTNAETMTANSQLTGN